MIGKADSTSWECELYVKNFSFNYPGNTIFFRPNGIRFTAVAGTTSFTKRWDPQPGDIVSFKHHGFLEATKKPKLPTLYRLRPDLVWENVVQNWKEKKPNPTGKSECIPSLYFFD